MSRWAAIALALVCLPLLACASAPSAPAVVKQAVAEPPCKADVPPRPTFPAETLSGQEDLWTIGTALWADHQARRAYELQLETALRGCTELSRSQ